MKFPDMRTRVEELLTTEPDSVRGDWHHYPCFMCTDSHGHGSRMGINVVTGKVHCLRCGFDSFIHVDGRLTRSQPVEKVADLDKWEYSRSHDGCKADDCVDRIMQMRGYSPDTSGVGGWAYGRGAILGYPVFPCVNGCGTLLYAQRKNTEGYKPKYLATRTEPRLDWYADSTPDAQPVSRRVLVLVEGPMDMVRVRVSLPWVWCCYNSGTAVKRSIIRDIVKARARNGLPQKVVCLFDAEEDAYCRANDLTRALTLVHGVPASAVRWEREDMILGTDPDKAHTDTLRGILAPHM